MRRCLPFLLTGVLTLATAAANAAIVHLDFTTTVNVGSQSIPVAGHYVIDTSQPGEVFGSNRARYATAVVEGQVIAGGTTYFAVTDFGQTRIIIQNDAPSKLIDGFGMWAPIRVDSSSGGLLALQLYDASQSVFDNIALPEFDFSLDAFDSFSGLSGTAIGLFDIQGIPDNAYELETLTYTVVPIPAGGVLLLSALCGLGAARRRRPLHPVPVD